MIEVPITIAESSSHPEILKQMEIAVREFESHSSRNRSEIALASFQLPRSVITDELLQSLRSTAQSLNHEHFDRAIEVLQIIRSGRMRAIPNSWALVESLLTYLERSFIDGWVYRRSDYGSLEAIRIDTISKDSYGQGYQIRGLMIDSAGRKQGYYSATGRSKGLPTTFLTDFDVMAETPALKDEYLKQIEHFIEITGSGPGHQCIADGIWSSNSFEKVRQRRVVVETELSEDVRGQLEAQLSGEIVSQRVDYDDSEPTSLPLNPIVSVFDLSGEGMRSISTSSLKSYEYREDIRSQLVLPDSHGRVIDVLTSQTGSVLADVIHGKGAGNLVLCKGVPGVGKTLTAEIIAETLKRPLYTVDASSILGAESVREAMTAAFDRVRRWDAVLLLDEADVVIGARGNDLERNRVTAELLRALESFERLAFLTTNRPEDVDDAIISRCVAIIEYKAPTGDAAKRAWLLLGDQLEEGFVSEELAQSASEYFHGMAPRDIRQLLRLSFQMAKADSRVLDLELLKESVVFRAWTPRD